MRACPKTLLATGTMVMETNAKRPSWPPATHMEDHLSASPPDLLFHYTDQTGLLGITATQTLWASGIGYLNDFSELSHAVKTSIGLIDTRLSANPAANHRDYLNRFHTGLSLYANRQDSVVASLSELGDDLSQWRAYSRSGTGYALGFNGPSLKRLAACQDFILGRCIYDMKMQRDLLDRFIEKSLLEVDEEIAAGINYDQYSALEDKYLWRVMTFGPLFKHSSFAAEQEWRLVKRLLGPPQEFRRGTKSIIPFANFALSNDSESFFIRQLIVGPCPEPEIAGRAANDLLLRRNKPISGVPYQVSSSQIPLRNW